MEASHLDANLNEDQALILSSVAEFARDVVAPAHEALDHAGGHAGELFDQIKELGLFGILLPEDLGGAGAGAVAWSEAVAAMARAGGIAGAFLCAQGIVLEALGRSGHEGLAEHLEGLATGETLGSPAFAEAVPGVLACEAEPAGDGHVLRGRKEIAPWPGRAGLFCVTAKLDGAARLFAVEAGAAGVTAGPAEEVLGLHGLEAGPLVLDGAPATLLGDADLLEDILALARIGVASLLGGVGRGAVDHAHRYGGERKQFDTALRDFPAMQERLVDGDATVEALRGLVRSAAALRDAGQPHAHAARRARHFAARQIVRVAHDGLQVYGGYGYSREYPAERFYRDACFPGFGEHVAGQILAASTDGLA